MGTINAQNSATKGLVEAVGKPSLRKSVAIADARCFSLLFLAVQSLLLADLIAIARGHVDILKFLTTAILTKTLVPNVRSWSRRRACAARRLSETSPVSLLR